MKPTDEMLNGIIDGNPATVTKLNGSFVELLKTDISQCTSPNFENTTGFFHLRTANECIEHAKSQPIPRKLFYSLLFEKELTILFADTGVGKSILAVQIAEEISKTEKVLYLDLELSDKQFQGRYSENYQDEYKFNSNLLRVVFKRRFEIPDNISYEDYFIQSLMGLIEETGAKVIIIDNMTRLITGDTDQAKSAKPLMDSLNNLKFDHDLTLLLLEHTKKMDITRPIHLNDLQGSKMKANFADAIICIGRSELDSNLRYVKQLKVRSCEVEFDSENVLVYEIVKEDSFLNFKLKGYANEIDHLKQRTENDKSMLVENVKKLIYEGKTQRDIAQQLNLSLGCVNKYAKL